MRLFPYIGQNVVLISNNVVLFSNNVVLNVIVPHYERNFIFNCGTIENNVVLCRKHPNNVVLYAIVPHFWPKVPHYKLFIL